MNCVAVSKRWKTAPVLRRHGSGSCTPIWMHAYRRSRAQRSVPPAVCRPTPRQQGQLPVAGGSDRDNYQAAFELLKAQRYEAASTAFQQFLVAFPESELADNAQYWLAESYYVTQKFSDALAAFEVVTNDYPRSRKLPDALLKIGYCNYELKNWVAARTALSGVRADFPESTAARLAQQRLERMQEEGV